MKLVANVDGGSRGNPGPAAIGVVIADASGAIVEEVAETIGIATNNVAEYKAVLRAIERAKALGASELELIGDSELVCKQITGAYKVKHEAMKPLFMAARDGLASIPAWSFRTVPRALNADADALVNQALDAAA
jgi:ribonuclease HI